MAGIKELMERLVADAAFAEDILKAGSVEEQINKIRQAGFEIAPEELAGAQKICDENSALSDDELEAVVGGSVENFQDLVEEAIAKFKEEFPWVDVHDPAVQNFLRPYIFEYLKSKYFN